MALSRHAAMHAAEIKQHDWSDAPYRADKAGHDRNFDGRRRVEKTLSTRETDIVRMNVMWVTAQVLRYEDPNFDVYEFAEACGVNIRNQDGSRSGGIINGLRFDGDQPCRPGTYAAG
jgi:hypothetical protein